MKVRFNLKDRRAFRCLILLKYTYPGNPQQFTWSTGQHIAPEDWDDRRQRVRARSAQARWLNALLDKMEAFALNQLHQGLVERQELPTQEELRAALNREFRNRVTTSLEQFVEQTIARMESRRRSYHTTKMIRTAWRNIEEFAEVTGKKLSWSALNDEFFESWAAWNYAQGRSKNTVIGYLKKMKLVLRNALQAGLIKSMPALQSFSLSFQRSDEVFLTVDELMQLYRAELPDHLQTVRDLFLLDAFSGGFRFTDLANLRDVNIVPIHNVKAIKLHTRKTDSLVYAPSSWYLEEFLEKYKEGFPRVKTNQTFNRQIKEICRLAGLTEVVELRKNRGGEDVFVRKQKWEWVTQYTARYSFATNLFLAGVDLKQISVLLGHSSIKITESYIKAKQLATVVAMSKNPYFAKKPV